MCGLQFREEGVQCTIQAASPQAIDDAAWVVHFTPCVPRLQEDDAGDAGDAFYLALPGEVRVVRDFRAPGSVDVMAFCHIGVGAANPTTWKLGNASYADNAFARLAYLQSCLAAVAALLRGAPGAVVVMPPFAGSIFDDLGVNTTSDMLRGLPSDFACHVAHFARSVPQNPVLYWRLALK